jgi:hypothetical protein
MGYPFGERSNEEICMSRCRQDIEGDINECDAKISAMVSHKGLLLEELISYGDSEPVKLCNIWSGVYVSLVRDPSVDELYRFDHIDGMVGICYDIHGDRMNMRPLQEVYAWGFGAEVEVRS